MDRTDRTAPGQSDRITFEYDLPHPPAKVWRALTEPTLLAQWLLPVTGLQLVPDASFTFQAPPLPEWDGKVRCRVLEIDAPRRISYSWVVGDMELDTVVTFTLSPTAIGTSLTLVQSGFKPSQKRNFGGARYGWTMMGEKLVTLLETVA